MAKEREKKDPEAFLGELREEVDANESIVATQMLDLRGGLGYGRLGPNVAKFISDKLAGKGLGHAPDPLPQDQWRTVLVFKLGSQVARLVHAVLQPSEVGAKELREATGSGAADVLAQVKALVCE